MGGGAGCEQTWAMWSILATMIPSFLAGAVAGITALKLRQRANHEDPPRT